MTLTFLCRTSLYLVIVLGVLLASSILPYAFAKRGHRHCRRTSPRPRLPDSNLLLIPGVRKKMESRGMIYRDDKPHHWWIVEMIDHSEDYDPYCQEVVYATVVLNRKPPVRYHRTCYSKDILASGPSTTTRCLTFAPGNRTDTCVPQTSYHVVKVDGRAKYQETYTGCVCTSSNRLSH